MVALLKKGFPLTTSSTFTEHNGLDIMDKKLQKRISLSYLVIYRADRREVEFYYFAFITNILQDIFKLGARDPK